MQAYSFSISLYSGMHLSRSPYGRKQLLNHVNFDFFLFIFIFLSFDFLFFFFVYLCWWRMTDGPSSSQQVVSECKILAKVEMLNVSSS